MCIHQQGANMTETANTLYIIRNDAGEAGRPHRGVFTILANAEKALRRMQSTRKLHLRLHGECSFIPEGLKVITK